MRLKGKVAVITGGASGMGLASVMRFLAEGAQVVIADYNAETGKAALTNAGTAGFGDAVSFIRTDVAREEDVIAMLAHAVDRFGQLDVVFNNAGVGGAIGPLTETSVADWDYTFDVLAKGVFLGIKHAARILRSQNTGGSIMDNLTQNNYQGKKTTQLRLIKKQNKGHKIGCYIRVSTEEQAENPEGSIRNQEERLKATVKLKNMEGLFGEIADVYIDRAKSGKDTNRTCVI